MNNYFAHCTTLDDAKSCYKRLAFELHPDVSGRDSGKEFVTLKEQFDAFRPASEKFEGEFDQWNSADFADVIEQLMIIPGIEIEVTGSFIWVSGDTKPVKEQLKAVDGRNAMNPVRWARKKAKWYFSPVGYQRRGRKTYDMDEIRARYGSATVNKKSRVAIG